MTTVAGPPRAGWRERWAEQENGRRQRDYQAARAAWQQQEALHRHCLEVATSFQPASDQGTYAWLGLKRGETLYWAAGGVVMVELPYATGLPAPHYQAFAATHPAPGVPAAGSRVAAGRVAVTSQRVVFVGPKRREWAFAKLTGLTFAGAGETLLLVSNRKKVSGVAPPLDAALDFRLHLLLALTDVAGDRAGFIRHLGSLADRHRQAAPPVPPPASPAQAPASAWFSGGRLAAVLAAAPLLFVLLCAIGTALAGNNGEGETPRTPAGAAAAQRTTPATTAPDQSRAPSTAPSVDTTPSAGPLRQEPTTQPDRPAGPVGDCAAYADSDEWCVDGIGDYDCEGGSGNGPNYAPPDIELVQPGEDPFGLDRNNDGVGCERDTAPAPPPQPPPPPPADTGNDPRFDTCGDAKAAGYGPYYRGQDPEYDWYRDADGDGIVCE